MPYISGGTQTSAAATQPINITQVGGAVISLGQKTSALSFPVVIASDQSTLNVSLAANQSINVAQIAGATTSTAASGTILAGVADGSGTKITSASTTTTGKTGLDSNILSILGTAPTTAGFLDIKGADGNVFVRQTTGSNLHMAVDSGTITTVTTVSNVAQINGNNITAASTTTTSKTGLDSNILSILGTAPTTAGFLDIKGADGNVFVRQTSAANLLTTANIRDGSGNALTSNSTTTTSKTALDSNILSILGTIANTAAAGTILVGVSDGNGTKITSASTTTTAKTGLDANILSILGTAPTTAGFIDIKGADGNVFVRNATVGNFLATVNIRDGAGNVLTSNSTTTTSKTALDSNILSVLGTIASTAASGTILVGLADGAGNKVTTNSTTTTSKTALDSNILSVLGTIASTAASGTILVGLSDGSGSKLTSNSTTTTSKTAIDVNILSVLGTVPTTAGFLNITPASNAGWTFFYNAGGISSTKVQIKATSGTFGGYINLMNPNTATTFIQVFNKASANVTVGSTTPDFVIVLPGVASASATGAAANLEITMGVAMGTGITVAATTTETGSSAPSNPIWCTFLYK